MSEKEPIESQGDAPIDAAPPKADGIENAEPVGTVDLPGGWKYKRLNLFGLHLPWYASPKVQLLMVSFVCFMCPGMYNALSGLGGGGKIDPTLADNIVSGKPCFCFEIWRRPILTVDETEHRSLQYFRCLRLLWWNLRQQARCEMDSGFRRCGILHLCDQLAGVGSC
jgi:hypothetical protein